MTITQQLNFLLFLENLNEWWLLLFERESVLQHIFPLFEYGNLVEYWYCLFKCFTVPNQLEIETFLSQIKSIMFIIMLKCNTSKNDLSGQFWLFFWDSWFSSLWFVSVAAVNPTFSVVCFAKVLQAPSSFYECKQQRVMHFNHLTNFWYEYLYILTLYMRNFLSNNYLGMSNKSKRIKLTF